MPRPKVLARAAVAFGLMAVLETGWGVAREAVVVPRVGREAGGRLGLATAVATVVGVAVETSEFVGAETVGELVGVGVTWYACMASFDAVLGHYARGMSWAQVAESLDPTRTPLGVAMLGAMLCAPFVGALVRAKQAKRRITKPLG